MENNSIAKFIAESALHVGAIKVTGPDNPFTWAKGWKTPMYNDNRKHLGFPENRKLILESFLHRIAQQELEFDYVLGTSMSAIAWGALVAFSLEKPFIMLHKETAYEFPRIQHGEILFWSGKNSNIPVLTNAPWGIPETVLGAHVENRPFMYERRETKSHGLKNKIEGNPVKGSEIDTSILTPYLSNYSTTPVEEIPGFFDVEVLMNLGLRTREVGSGATVVHPTELKGKKILIIEDLISTGGSSLEEAKICRAQGGIVTDIIVIYNYEFPIAKEKAEAMGVKIHNLLTYDQLLQEAVIGKYIKEADLEILKEWRPNPEAWSDKYCGTTFTKVSA